MRHRRGRYDAEQGFRKSPHNDTLDFTSTLVSFTWSIFSNIRSRERGERTTQSGTKHYGGDDEHRILVANSTTTHWGLLISNYFRTILTSISNYELNAKSMQALTETCTHPARSTMAKPLQTGPSPVSTTYCS